MSEASFPSHHILFQEKVEVIAESKLSLKRGISLCFAWLNYSSCGWWQQSPSLIHWSQAHKLMYFYATLAYY